MKKNAAAYLLLIVLFLSCKKNNIDDDGGSTNNADKKIGYIFYTEFIDEFNQKLYESFSRFKTEGVTDLIVDLRYNHGGSIAAASYLASLIAPQSVVQSGSVFSQLDFNSFINGEYDKNGWSRKSMLGRASGGASNPIGANLNLKTVYIIATDDSYSASELLTFCLRPYMRVVHVGSKTGGKFTASMTVTAYDSYGNKTNTIYDPARLTNGAKDSLKNWGMQPIVAIYKDSRNNDFSQAGALVPDVAVESRENDANALKPLGDQTDYLLAATIAHINGSNTSGFQNSTSPRSVTPLIPAKLYGDKIDVLKKEAAIWKPVNAANANTAATGINTISQFVYDGMAVFYKWSGDMISKTPTPADNDPEAYFSKLLNPLDTQHGWSWITNDVSALLADFSGQPVDFGWSLNFLWADATRTKLVAIVKYVYPNTPAATAGIKRGDVIARINGADITANPNDNGFYLKLLGDNSISVSVTGTNGSKNVTVAPVTITTNPVLKDSIYTFKR